MTQAANKLDRVPYTSGQKCMHCINEVYLSSKLHIDKQLAEQR